MSSVADKGEPRQKVGGQTSRFAVQLDLSLAKGRQSAGCPIRRLWVSELLTSLSPRSILPLDSPTPQEYKPASAVPTFCDEIPHKPARRRQVVFSELADTKVSEVCFL
jgi:hypothetical protein